MAHHSVLRRQLKRLALDEQVPPSPQRWRALLETVTRTYEEADEDRSTSERSLAVSSRELRQLYDDLKRSTATQLDEERHKLSLSLAVHKATLEAAADGVLIVDDQRRVIAFNRRFTQLWGVAGEVVEAGDSARLLEAMLGQLSEPGEFLARAAYLYQHPGESSQEEIALRDGRAFERHSAPVVTGSGRSLGRVWFFRDVSARKRDEARIQEMNRFLDSIFENIPDMVFVQSAADLSFVRFNRAGEELLGLKREELVGRTDADFFPPAQARLRSARDREVLAQRGVITIDEEKIETRHKGARYLHTKKIPIVDQDGAPRYLLGISEDITALRQKEIELRQAKEAAERASRAKSEFLLNMSHELRTPLNAIVGFSRVLTREVATSLSETQQEYLRDIVAAGGYMLQLVNDLLDLRSLEQRRLDIAPIELAPLIEQGVGMVRSLIQERRLELVLDLPTDLPPAMAHRRSVVQIVVNLVSNAAKFTPPAGRISVTAQVHGPWIEVAVGDSGVGIAPADQSRLFVYFEQLGGKHEHHMKGSGVGLALTRALVEKQGGEISVESVPGQGSTFRFLLEAAL